MLVSSPTGGTTAQSKEPPMTARRLPTTVAVVTDEDGRRTDVVTYTLGHWEKGALQVLFDALTGALTPSDPTLADTVRSLLAAEETTLGATPEAVADSIAHLGSLVRGFSQADDVVVTATVR